MKRKSILTILACLMMGFTVSSCLKDQEDTFDKAPAIRLQDYMSRAKTTLESATNGWLFEIYPAQGQPYGGYAFTVKFEKGQAEVRSILRPDQTATSYYRITAENGPAITFDTYNDLMHLFSNPSAQSYQAYRGDFEFVVDSIGDDLVRVHGYRTKNVMYLRKLNEPAADYLDRVNKFAEAYGITMKYAFNGKLNGIDVKGEISPSSRKITVTVGDKQYKETLAFTDKGVRLYEPINIGGVELTELEFDQKTSTYQAKDTKGNVTTLQADLPGWYKRFYAYEGTYDLTMTADVMDSNGDQVKKEVTTEVQLEPGDDYTYYSLKGLNDDYDINLSYDQEHDRLLLTYQTLTRIPNRRTIRLVPWDTVAGMIWMNSNIGLYLQWNESEKAYHFVDNGVWKTSGGYTVSGFILYVCNSKGKLVDSADKVEFMPYLLMGNSAFIQDLKTLKKKK
ncbi:MAG: DUF4302 domain-containing protein [Hoylesella enoeca]|uniref:DUF4302 domain-containing protein n=1 Tax=Hoylesella enoeca TaxID=76123 RepID=UPI00288A571E|nr:DUF4302 domain-containing protein [Hoylesella enoeca]